MFRKNYFVLLSAIGVILLSTVFASAQTANITGTVQLEKEDGTKAPVEGALVEIYRMDMTTGNKSDKTDAKGAFIFAGVPPGAKYLLAVSAPDVEPVIVPISSGMTNQVLTVKPGDGTRWTEEEVRAAPGNSANSAELTAEQKKKQEEIEKERARIEAKNKKVEESNEVIQRVLKEGNDAFNSKNYDVAIVKFQEGYDVSEDYAGSAPVLLNNKATSYMMRAIINYNAAVKASDATTRTEMRKKATEDFENALADYNKSWNILKNSKSTDVSDQEVYKKAKSDALQGGNKVVGYLIQTQLSVPSKAEAAKELVSEYAEFETDKAKKAQARTNIAKFLLGAGDIDSSIVEFRKANELTPNDPDILGNLGIALFTAGESNESMEQKQQSLNFMQAYLDKAPKDHDLRESVEGLVALLKSQKMKPQKIQ